MVQTAADEQYYYGTGKRKTSVAKVRLYPDDDGGLVLINSKPMEEYFNWQPWQETVTEAFRASGTNTRFRVVVRVNGGGVHSQAQAIRNGIAWALVAYDDSLKAPLRRRELITRDARIKESKKYGLKRARRAPQYTKR